MAKGTKILNSALKVDDDGALFITVGQAAPDDGDVSNLEISLWIDGGDGNKLKIKGRLGATVYAYEIAPE